ncbi:MAG: UbiA family prenyltransferase, partial [Betaproteobacteria bacterium]
KIGIRTTALLFGRHDVAIIMACYAAMLAIMAVVGKVVGLGWPYFTGLALACGIALFHYKLIRERVREECFKAFRHNNWLGFTVFCGVMFDYAIRPG